MNHQQLNMSAIDKYEDLKVTNNQFTDFCRLISASAFPHFNPIFDFGIFDHSQPVPALCDDVLLEIFGKLKLDDLVAVAKCSRRFEALAQTAFRISLDGPLQLCEFEYIKTIKYEYDTQRTNEQYFPKLLKSKASERLLLFDTHAKHIECECTTDEWQMKWCRVNLAKLQSIKIDFAQIASLCEQRTQFTMVEHLELMGSPSHHIDIDFGQCFPKLKSLVLEHHIKQDMDERHFPRGLRSLNMIEDDESTIKALLRLSPELCELRLQQMPMEVNNLIDYMVDCGIHSSLKSLVLYNSKEPDTETDNLTHQMPMFGKLETLEILYDDTVGRIENLELLAQLPNLKKMTIAMTEDVARDFLDSLPDIISPNLKEFVMYGVSDNSFDMFEWMSFDIPETCMVYGMV